MKLPASEEQLMKHLWAHEPVFMGELLDSLPEPKLAKTTVATLLRRLIEKQAVTYDTFGNSRRYRTLISKQDYFGGRIRNMIATFFDASPMAFASMFAEQTDLTAEQLEELRQIIDRKKEEL